MKINMNFQQKNNRFGTSAENHTPFLRIQNPGAIMYTINAKLGFVGGAKLSLDYQDSWILRFVSIVRDAKIFQRIDRTLSDFKK